LNAWNEVPVPSGAKNTLKISFREIQMEEEKHRPKVQYSDGNTNPWYIERRSRADSLDEVIKEQLQEKEKEKFVKERKESKKFKA